MSEHSTTGGLILSESRAVRLFSFFLFYFGQGLPVGVSAVALPAWVAANGGSAADVAALVAMTYLPWSFKFIPAALMDRYSYLAMGRRRAWLIFAQGLMMAGFAMAAFAAPGPDDVPLLLNVVFLIGAGAAIQDVAVDGLAVDIVPDREQGPASSFMFGGQTVGRAISGAGSGVMLQAFGSQAAFLAFLPVILIITLYAIVLRERPGEKRLPWSPGQSSPVNLERQVDNLWKVLTITLRALIGRDSLVLVAGSALYRTAGGILTAAWPLLATTYLAYTTATYSSMISLVDLVMAVASIAIGSFLTVRFGARVATILVVVMFAGLALFVWLGFSLWTIPAVFIGMSAVYAASNTLTSICSNPLRMQLSDPQVAATQFTIYNSISNLPVSLGAMLFAWLGGTEHLGAVMALATGLFVVAALVLAVLRVGDAHARGEPAPAMN